MKKSFVYTGLASAIAMAINPAFAEENSSQAELLEAIEVVGTLNKLDAQPFNQAKSATVISQQTLQEEGVVKADELGRYQAGFVNQTYGSDTNTNWFNIRGAKVSQSLDGSPMLEQGFFTPQIDLFGLEAVEVVKGADSMAYGKALSGGLINYISKRPHKDLVGGGTIVSYVGNKNQRGIGLDYTGGLNADNSLRYRLVGSYARADGEWNGTWSESYYFAPSLSWDISDRTHLTLLASYLKNVGVPSSNFLPQLGSLVATPQGKIARHANLGDPTQDYERNHVKSIGYEFSHDFGAGLTFSQNYRYQYISNQHQGAYAYPSLYDANWNPIPFTNDLTRGVVYNNGRAKSHSIDNRMTWQYNNDWLENTLLAGFDYRHQDFNSLYTLSGEASSVDVYNPSLSYGQPYSINAPHVHIKYIQQGYYVQNNARLWDKLGVTLGLRHDRIRNTELGRLLSDKNNHTSYQGSIMYFNDLGLNPYYAYSEAFSLPAGLNANETLYKPIISRQHEVGVKYMPSWLDGTISLAYFQARDTGALVMSATGEGAENGTPTKRKGIEFELRANITERLNALFAYTYLNSVERKTGARTALTPKHTLASRLAYQFTPDFNAGIGLRYIGNSVTATGSLYSGAKVPSATLVDLFASYNISPQWQARVNIDNLGNRKYLAGCDYYCYYGEGISGVASLSYKF
ncbi:iron complex outermembrane receptor protein [Volucribacter psittacicida]|uniref:Iron complex outermembrane receptor protein n=1 Tax=Volucribacter psittacicida TaxID=203482 RepID=A0A4R1FWG8_9PAST|nr:TonB-dependent receptor [Volucribacter psittacicida]TCJ98570.1 iron complex outermembrane receptor protein [Volucribacter psittacicida]